MPRSEHVTESNQALQQMIVKVSKIRRYRVETGTDHPDTDRIWDKINEQYHGLTADDKAIFDEFNN